MFCANFLPGATVYAAATPSVDAQTASLILQIQSLQDLITQLKLQLERQSATPVAHASTPMFKIGDRVQTAVNLNVRSTPNKEGIIVCKEPAGSLGTIAGGPQISGGYAWWNVNYDNSCSGWSIQKYLIKVKIDATPPSIPAGLTATPVSQSQINLFWMASTDNVGVSGYKVFRGGVQIATTVSTSYQDTGLAASTTYIYAVSAFDAAGNNSAQSASVAATTQLMLTAPTAPSNLTASFLNSTSGPSSVLLMWRDNSSNENGFGVERGVDGVNFSQTTTTGPNVYWYSDTGLASGNYFYRVQAFNGVGNSPYSNVATTTVP